MKLGDIVYFTQEYKSTKGKNFIDLDTFNDEQMDALENCGHIEKSNYELVDIKEQKGIVVGERQIGLKSVLQLDYDDTIGEEKHILTCTGTHMATVYLVATNFKGFHRVPKDNVKEEFKDLKASPMQDLGESM